MTIFLLGVHPIGLATNLATAGSIVPDCIIFRLSVLLSRLTVSRWWWSPCGSSCWLRGWWWPCISWLVPGNRVASSLPPSGWRQSLRCIWLASGSVIWLFFTWGCSDFSYFFSASFSLIYFILSNLVFLAQSSLHLLFLFSLSFRSFLHLSSFSSM